MLNRITLVASLMLAVGCGSSEAPAAPEPTPVATETPEIPASVTAIREFIATAGIDKSVGNWKSTLPKPPMLEFGDETIFWDLETSSGPISIELWHHVAPMHVSSVMYLSELGFYDGLTFHRVLANFMAQGGCPRGDGYGSPGYSFGGEFDPKVGHDRPGLLSHANGGPNTDGSQFFITFVPVPGLDNRHTVYGEVDGASRATLDAIELLAGSQRTNGTPPKERIEIKSAKIRF